MNTETLKQLMELISTLNGAETTNQGVYAAREYYPPGVHVVMRGRGSGVHYGEIEWLDRSTNSCKFKWSRRIWRWAGAFTLHELIAKGPKRPEDCRFSCRQANVNIVGDVCEIIELTESQLARLDEVKDDGNRVAI